MIIVQTPAAHEPLSISEVMTHLRLDASNAEPAPGSFSASLVSPAAAGNVTAGTRRYLATFCTTDGETQAGEASAAVTVADEATNGRVKLTGIPTGGALVTARKLYRTAAGGDTFFLLATMSDNSTSDYTDNTADAALGAQAPGSNTTSDPMLSAMIATARQMAEQALRRSLITQTLDLYLDAFPLCAILLPPAQSITSITYTDTSGAEMLLPADQYAADCASQPARIAPAYATTWPATREQVNAVKVRFVAGYGDASAVPACIKQWMLIKIAEMHPGVAAKPSEFTDFLLDPERVTGRITK